MEITAQTPNPPSFSTQPARRVDTSHRSSPASQQDADKAKQAEKEQQQQDQKILQQLRSRDREVRAHEAAHVAAAGQYVSSGPSYTYQRGPDGNTYAIGGEVRLDTSQEADPKKQLDKSETVRRAALAPAQPSPQDFSVAANATRSAAQARLEIAIQRRDEAEAQQKELESANESGETLEDRSSETEQQNEQAESVDQSRANTPPASNTGDRVANLYSQPSRPVGADFSQFV